MKIKKLVASIVFTGLVLVGLMGCKQSTDSTDPQTPSDVNFIEGISISNGALDIDPAEVSYIDIKFSKAMDQNYNSFWCYNYSHLDIYGTQWMTAYVLRIYVNLQYGTKYVYVINDSKAAGTNGYTRDGAFIRDDKGNIQEEYRIEFITKDSPNRINNQPMTHNLDLTALDKDYSIMLVDNDQYCAGTQHAVVSIKEFLYHEYVNKGDKVNLTYKIKSAYELKNIKMNLVDNSAAAPDYWKELSTGQMFIEQLDANTEKTGTISFDITADMARGFSLQIWATYEDNPDLITIDLLKK